LLRLEKLTLLKGLTLVMADTVGPVISTPTIKFLGDGWHVEAVSPMMTTLFC
jgi:hypothetical protein